MKSAIQNSKFEIPNSAERGDWISTSLGGRFWPLAPEIEDIRIEDIANSLAMKVRFNGHCREFYSVAQHSVLMAEALDPKVKLWGLLHDAGEAYLPDISRPIKPAFPEIVRLENEILYLVAQKYGLVWPIPADVHVVDLIALATEKRDVMVPQQFEWNDIKDIEPWPTPIVCWDWRTAKQAFLATFEKLHYGESSR